MSVIIKDIEKNEREIIRFDISEFKGKEYINIRIWFKAIDGRGDVVYKPSQKGVALNIDEFKELKDAITKVEMYLEDKNNGVVPDLTNGEEVFSSDITDEN